MLIRFSAGSFVASIAIAIASAGMLIFSRLNPQRFALILAIWCLVPCLWGLWAMLSPAGWVPRRLPIWGTILGTLAALLAVFVFDLPYRVLGIALAPVARAFSIPMGALFYYLLWTMVRIVYKNLSASAPSSNTGKDRSFTGAAKTLKIGPRFSA
jgi:hypothetical protein